MINNKLDKPARQSQIQLAIVERITGIGCWEWDFENHKLKCSENLYTLLGLDSSVNGLTPELFDEMICSEDLVKVKKTVQDSIENKSNFNFKCRIYKSNGDLRFFNTEGDVAIDASGKVIKLFGIAEDITDQLKKEQEIQRLSLIARNTSNAVIISDEKGHINWVNNAFYKITGYSLEEVYNRTSSEVLCGPLSDPLVRAMKEQKIINGEPFHCQLQKYRKDGQTFWVEIEGHPLFDDNGKYTHYFEIETDITEKKSIESEREQLSLIAQSTDNMVIITDEEDRIEWVNNAFIQKVGYSFEEVLHRKPTEILHGPKTEQYKRNSLKEKMRNRQPFSYELLWYTKEKKTLWVEIQGQPIINNQNEFVNYFRIGRDITDKKKFLENLIDSRNKIKLFANSLNKSIEQERARIARELHDELGQTLTGLKMSLSDFGNKLSKNEIIKLVNNDIEKAIHSLKEIATELRPGILDTLGLIPSLEWLVRETKKRSEINYSFSADSKREMFDEDVSITFFRICQEGLNNAVKHSGASKIAVKISYTSNVLTLEINDNGKGLPKEMINPMSLGILGMHERAELIGATLRISSNNSGTYLQLNKEINE